VIAERRTRRCGEAHESIGILQDTRQVSGGGHNRQQRGCWCIRKSHFQQIGGPGVVDPGIADVAIVQTIRESDPRQEIRLDGAVDASVEVDADMVPIVVVKASIIEGIKFDRDAVIESPDVPG
jgi:hypothetical protein